MDLDQDDEQPALVSALQDLLQSPGWAWIRQIAEQDYGPAGYGRRVMAAIAAIPAGPERTYELARVTEQIHEECQAVNALIKRPKDELAKLTQKKAPRPFDHLRRTMGAR